MIAFNEVRLCMPFAIFFRAFTLKIGNNQRNHLFHDRRKRPPVNQELLSVEQSSGMGFPRQTKEVLGPPYLIQDWQVRELQFRRKLLIVLAVELIQSSVWVIGSGSFKPNIFLSIMNTAPYDIASQRNFPIGFLIIEILKVSFYIVGVLYCFGKIKRRRRMPYQNIIALVDYMMFCVSTLPIISKTVFFLFYSPHRKAPILFGLIYLSYTIGLKIACDQAHSQRFFDYLLVFQAVASVYILMKLQFALRILIKRPLKTKVCRIRYLKDVDQSTQHSG